VSYPRITHSNARFRPAAASPMLSPERPLRSGVAILAQRRFNYLQKGNPAEAGSRNSSTYSSTRIAAAREAEASEAKPEKSKGCRFWNRIIRLKTLCCSNAKCESVPVFRCRNRPRESIICSEKLNNATTFRSLQNIAWQLNK